MGKGGREGGESDRRDGEREGERGGGRDGERKGGMEGGREEEEEEEEEAGVREETGSHVNTSSCVYEDKQHCRGSTMKVKDYRLN